MNERHGRVGKHRGSSGMRQPRAPRTAANRYMHAKNVAVTVWPRYVAPPKQRANYLPEPLA